MKILLAVAAVLVVPACSYAQGSQAAPAATGPKACDELKSEIAANLDAKGVKSYSLDIVAKDADAGDAKVVGTCEGGTKKILYKKTAAAAAPQAATKEPSKP